MDRERIGEAGRYAGGSELGANGALGLKAAELGRGTADDVVGMGASAIDGALGLVVGIGSVGEFRFDDAAAAQTPCGGHDFVGEYLFEDAVGRELEHEGRVLLGEFVFLAGKDVVTFGVEAVFGGIAGRAGFAVFGAGTGGSGGNGFVHEWLHGGLRIEREGAAFGGEAAKWLKGLGNIGIDSLHR